MSEAVNKPTCHLCKQPMAWHEPGRYFECDNGACKAWRQDQRWRLWIDPATIPDDVLRSEWGRRNNAKRKTKGAGPGRPRKTAKPCSWCNTDAAEAAKIHEGPHSTWCPRYTKLHSMKP